MNASTTPAQGALLAEVDRIAAMSDPVARNLEITRLYYELELALVSNSPSANSSS